MKTQYPIRIPDGTGVKVLNNAEEEREYLQGIYRRGHQNHALMGQPTRNFVLQPTEEERRRMSQQQMLLPRRK